ncbi:MAG: DUF5615 family PIN-like protein [Chitinophagales bacterium]
MQFLIDAQLPPSWVKIFQSHGFKAIHTRDLEKGNLSSDQIIIELSERNNWIIVTKDSDFYYSHITTGKPNKLVFVKLGNMRIKSANGYLNSNIQTLIKALKQGSLVELWADGITVIS